VLLIPRFGVKSHGDPRFKQRQQKSKTILLMERKSSKEYSAVFLVEGKKFKL